jgi:hypothetical protein
LFIYPHDAQRGVPGGPPLAARPTVLSRQFFEAKDLAGCLADQRIGVSCQLPELGNREDPQATVRRLAHFFRQK